MKEPIQRSLEIAGSLMEFESFEIFGIPGFHYNALYRGEQVLSTVEDQLVSFQVSTLDVIENEIIKDMLFSITDNAYIYSFKVSRPTIQDFTGWSLLEVYYQNKVIE